MKKNVIIATVVTVIIAILAVYFYKKNTEAKKKLIPTQPLAVASLRESLTAKNVSIDGACANPESLTKDLIDLSVPELKEKFNYICEDQEIAKKLEENFSANTDYKYFVNCAKTHATNMQQITNDLKEHYPADYKELNFNKEHQEAILLKYLKHPKSAFLMAQCESKSEALYWRSIIDSGKVEDLKFCQKITEECINGQIDPAECPVNFKSYHEECTKKLNGMKH